MWNISSASVVDLAIALSRGHLSAHPIEHSTKGVSFPGKWKNSKSQAPFWSQDQLKKHTHLGVCELPSLALS